MHKNKVTNCSLLRHLSLLHRKRTQIYAAHFRFLLTPLSPQTQVYKTRHYTLISLLRPVSLGQQPLLFQTTALVFMVPIFLQFPDPKRSLH